MSDPHISAAKRHALERRMEELGLREDDLVEKFVHGSGKGGQKLNKTASCCQLRHEPSGIEVTCQRERSLASNRFLARRELCERYAEEQLGIPSKRSQRAEKIRKQKRRRQRRARKPAEEMIEKSANCTTKDAASATPARATPTDQPQQGQ